MLLAVQKGMAWTGRGVWQGNEHKRTVAVGKKRQYRAQNAVLEGFSRVHAPLTTGPLLIPPPKFRTAPLLWGR